MKLNLTVEFLFDVKEPISDEELNELYTYCHIPSKFHEYIKLRIFNSDDSVRDIDADFSVYETIAVEKGE